MGFLDMFFGKKRTEEKVSTEGVRFLEEEASKSIKTLPITITHPQQHYIIKSDGKYFIYDSLEEMDKELRNQIESSEKIDEMKSIYTVFVDGKRTIYTHFNDIPDTIREAITKKKQG